MHHAPTSTLLRACLLEQLVALVFQARRPLQLVCARQHLLVGLLLKPQQLNLELHTASSQTLHTGRQAQDTL
jgi:hypothetical protein